MEKAWRLQTWCVHRATESATICQSCYGRNFPEQRPHPQAPCDTRRSYVPALAHRTVQGQGVHREDSRVRLTSNNTFERTVVHVARRARMDCALAGAQWPSWAAAQLGRGRVKESTPDGKALMSNNTLADRGKSWARRPRVELCARRRATAAMAGRSTESLERTRDEPGKRTMIGFAIAVGASFHCSSTSSWVRRMHPHRTGLLMCLGWLVGAVLIAWGAVGLAIRQFRTRQSSAP